MAEFVFSRPEHSALGLAEVARRGGAERQAPKHIQTARGVVARDFSVTSMMHDSQSPSTMRVKSGYEGHVPQSRFFVGSSYRSLVNRGVPGPEPGKAARATLPANFHTPKVEERSQGQAARSMFHDPFTTGAGDRQHEYGIATTARVPARVEQILSGDTRNVDSSNFKLDPWLMVGYCGHAPKAGEVLGTTFYGPPEGPAYHGPRMKSSAYNAPAACNREAIAP